MITTNAAGVIGSIGGMVDEVLKASRWNLSQVLSSEAWDAVEVMAYRSWSRDSTNASTPRSFNAANASVIVPRRRFRTTGTSGRVVRVAVALVVVAEVVP